MNRIDALLAGRRPLNDAYFAVCVDGRGASGKTSLAAWLSTRLDGFAVIHGDDWFERHDHPVTWGDFNEARFDTEVLWPIRSGARAMSVRRFDFPTDRLTPARDVTVQRGVLVERWGSLALPVAWDLTIWVETPRDVCLERGLTRDAADALGERARLAWEQVWQPREDAFVAAREPTLTADLSIAGTEPFAEQLQ